MSVEKTSPVSSERSPILSCTGGNKLVSHFEITYLIQFNLHLMHQPTPKQKRIILAQLVIPALESDVNYLWSIASQDHATHLININCSPWAMFATTSYTQN